MRLILFGPPGAGKGTQASLLKERKNLAHISTGEIIRAAMKSESPLGDEARSFVTAGKLVPDTLVRKLAEDAIARHDNDDFILDGYPRTLQQAEWLDEYLADNLVRLTAVVSLKVEDFIIIDRLSKRRVNKETGENYHLDFKPPPVDVPSKLIMQRRDDLPEAIQTRLKEYRDVTLPLEEYFKSSGRLIEVDGVGSMEAVYERIVAGVAAREVA
ncbi:MAG: adenylate kinase [Rhodothermales bacterium]|nr:adenylate kinase [Rhodothermales bacterium]